MDIETETFLNLTIQNPRYNSIGTIDVDVNHPIHGWLPFTSHPESTVERDRVVYERAVNGEYGPIAAFEPPANIDGEEALNMIRQKRNRILLSRVDPIVTNPLRWGDLSEAQQNELAAYRQSLLDITDTFPNVYWAWDNPSGDHKEQNITWPSEPEWLDAKLT